jgi:hypothetical protein
MSRVTSRAVIFAMLLPVLALASVMPSNAVTVQPSTPVIGLQLDHVKLLSYMESAAGWSDLWTQWNPAQVNSDFTEIASMNFNTVRLVLQAYAFGYPYPSDLKLDELTEAVGLASAHGLRVQLTLFDSWSQYSDLSGSRRWAGRILSRVRANPVIQSIELQNELDPSYPIALAWAREMIPYVRVQSGRIPVTISAKPTLTNLLALRRALGALPDFYSFHYYGRQEDAVWAFRHAKAIASPRPLFVGEGGRSSSSGPPNAPPDQAGEQAQAQYIATLEYAAQIANVPPVAPWVFQDFVAGTFRAGTPNYRYHYGVLRLDGTEKPAAQWLRQYMLVH